MSPVTEQAAVHRERLVAVFVKQRVQLSRIAFDIVKNAAIAEEITQDAYIRVCHCNGADQIQNYKAYCGQVVRNIALDIYRRRNKQSAYNSEEDFDQCLEQAQSPCQTPEQSAYLKEVLSAVLNKLSTQPECQRQVFMLHYTENLTQREIAVELGCSPASVNIYLRKVRQALMQCDICRAFAEYMNGLTRPGHYPGEGRAPWAEGRPGG